MYHTYVHLSTGGPIPDKWKKTGVYPTDTSLPPPRRIFSEISIVLRTYVGLLVPPQTAKLLMDLISSIIHVSLTYYTVVFHYERACVLWSYRNCPKIRMPLLQRLIPRKTDPPPQRTPSLMFIHVHLTVISKYHVHSLLALDLFVLHVVYPWSRVPAPERSRDP